MPQNFEVLEKLIRYRFRDKGLLRQALTPPSAGLPTDNQRLEFFGDSVLHLCTTRLVYNAHTDWQEGPLSRLRGKIVSTDSLYVWAKDLDIVLERGPRSPKKNKAPSSKELADAVEALLAAVVLDSEASGEDGFAENGLAGDGLANALKIIEERFGEAINSAGIGDWEQDDPKTALQERAAAMGLEVPVYELIERSGPEHAPVFCCSVKVGEFQAAAKGPTLKRSHMEAARQLLGLLSKGSIT